MLRFLRISIEALLIVVVVFSTLAFGGTARWAWPLIEFAVALAVVLWLLRMLITRKIFYVKSPLNVLLILLLLYFFFQLLPLPAGVLKAFQPNTLRVHTVGPANVPQAASAPLPDGGAYPVSLNRWRSRGHLFLYMAYVGFFLVFLNNVTRRQQLGRLLGVMLASAALVSIAGFATIRQDERLLYRRWSMGGDDERPAYLNADANPEFSAGYGFVFGEREGDRVDWYVPKTHGGDVFGGFPLSNSAATVMVMGLLLALGVFLAYLATRRAEWGKSGGLLYTREGNITMLAIFTALLLVGGLAVSKSRGGIAVAAALVPLLIVLCGFSRSLLAGIITLVVILAVVIVPLAVLGPSDVADFIGQRAALWLQPWQEEVRFTAREATWHIIGDFPMFGTGVGTFGNVYPTYKIRGPMLYFAHCDPLQWIAETGLVGSVLAGAILLVWAVTVVVGWFRLKDPFVRRLLLGTTFACLAFVAHGVVDFPLQVPGIAILFVGLAAASIVMARDQIARHEEKDFIF